MRLLRTLRYECSRMFFSRRWWIILVVAGLLTSFTVYDLTGSGGQGDLMAHHLTFNAWDVVIRATQSWTFAALIIAPAFVWITGESHLRDRSSNTMPATFPRVQSRVTWWTAKVLSMFIGAFVYMVVFSLVSLLVASCFYPFAWHFSSFQLHPALARKALKLHGGSDLTRTVQISETMPLLFLLHMLLYSTLSFGTYATAVLVVSLRVRKPGLPVLLLWGIGIGEFYIADSRLWIPLRSWLLQTRLPYLRLSQASSFYTLPGSILYCLVLSALLCLIGMLFVQHDDL